MKTYLTLILLTIMSSACDKPTQTDTTQTTGATVAMPEPADRAQKSSPGGLTPIDQGHAQADVDTTLALRRSLMSDDTLSFAGKNVTIVTSGGVITLRGPVQNAEEKRAIESKAQLVAGSNRVDSQLEVTFK